jgi:hypothetical protein
VSCPPGDFRRVIQFTAIGDLKNRARAERALTCELNNDDPELTECLCEP